MKSITFTEALFPAVINGTKTQTRRIMKSQPDGMINGTPFFYGNGINDDWRNYVELKPRYKVGETVYLKEPYRFCDFTNVNFKIEFKFSNKNIYFGKKLISEDDKIINSEIEKFLRLQKKSKTGYINKLFVPSWLQEYFPNRVEITDVRCERLQEISDEDCKKEGVFYDIKESDYFHYYDCENRFYCGDCEITGRNRLIKEVLEDRERFGFDSEDDEDMIKDELNGYSCEDDCEVKVKTCDICGKILSGFKYNHNSEFFHTPQQAYAALIDSINGRGTWERNPYVWVYSFKLLNNK